MSPDGPKSLPPEERLLRLIRGKGPVPEPSGGTAHGASEGSQSLEASGPVSTPAVVPKPLGVRTWRLPSWWLAAVNWSLGGLVLVEVVSLLVIATRPASQPSIAAPGLKLHDPLESGNPSALEDQTLGVGLSQAASRPLFQPLSSTAQSGLRPAVALSQEAKELAGRLNVIGLVDGDPPQAIIEDAQTQKTYFVAAGQHVTDGLVVTDIREDRVVLDLNGQTIELSL